MKKADNLITVHSFLKDHELSLLYISRENCSVCHSLLPQVERLLEKYPEVSAMQVEAEFIPEVSGEFTVFTVPAVIVFVEGKEIGRKARFVPEAELESLLMKSKRYLGIEDM